MTRRELLLGLTALALTMTLVAWRAYALGYRDATTLEALICAPLPVDTLTHPATLPPYDSALDSLLRSPQPSPY